MSISSSRSSRPSFGPSPASDRLASHRFVPLRPGKTPAWLGSLSNTHTFGSRFLHEVGIGYFDLQNTRISKHRDIFNSTLGIYNPLEHGIGGLAALMPTIDISTQRSSGGIGNAWDFFDVQRLWSVSDRVSLVTGRHTVQAGFEYRRIKSSDGHGPHNGDLDYDNWVFFFTGHGAAGGGSDLDQGDTRRDFIANDIGGFVQDDWHVGGGLTVNAGLRYDIYGNFSERNGRIGNYYLPDAAAALGVQPGFQVPANAPFFQPDFTPLAIGLVVDPGTRIDLSQIHEAKYESTVKGDYNNIAPRIGLAWHPSFAPKFVVRGGWGVYYERTGASHKKDLQLAAPFFILQNVPAPPDMADPYPRLNVNPFQIPLNVRIARDANGAARWLKEDGTPFPASSPFNAKSNVFVDPLIRTPYLQQWTTNVQYEVRRRADPRRGLRGIAGRGPARQGQPGGAAGPAGHAGQRLHRHLRPAWTPDQPGLLRPRRIPRPESQRRIPAAHQRRPFHLSQPAGQGAGERGERTHRQRRLHPGPFDGHALFRRRPRGTRSDAARKQLRAI